MIGVSSWNNNDNKHPQSKAAIWISPHSTMYDRCWFLAMLKRSFIPIPTIRLPLKRQKPGFNRYTLN